MKSRLIAGDRAGAEADARWALEAGAAESESPIGLYAVALAQLVLGESVSAVALQGREDFPGSVADAVVGLAARDAGGYETAIRGSSPTSRAGTSSSRTRRSRTPSSRSRCSLGNAVWPWS